MAQVILAQAKSQALAVLIAAPTQAGDPFHEQIDQAVGGVRRGFLLGQVIQQHLGLFQVSQLGLDLGGRDQSAAAADNCITVKSGREEQGKVLAPGRQVRADKKWRLINQHGIPGKNHLFFRQYRPNGAGGRAGMIFQE